MVTALVKSSEDSLPVEMQTHQTKSYLRPIRIKCVFQDQ